MSKVVITGLGAVTPLGNDVPSFWEGMKAGRSGADHIRGFDASDFPVKIASEVKDFDPGEWMDKKGARRLSRASQFSLL